MRAHPTPRMPAPALIEAVNILLTGANPHLRAVTPVGFHLLVTIANAR